MKDNEKPQYTHNLLTKLFIINDNFVGNVSGTVCGCFDLAMSSATKLA